MAKLGQLYLQKGIWKGKQILPKSWIEEASSAQIMQDPDAPKNIKDIDDSKQGYGYQIWRGRHNTYRADGAFAQFIVVMADFDAVIAIQCYERDIQKVSNCLWDYLLPAFKSDKPLPADSLAKQNLQKRLDALEIKPLCTQNKLQLPAANQWRANLLADTLSAEATLTLYGNGDSIRLDWKTDSLNSGAFVFGDCAWLHGQVWRQPPSLIPVPSTWREFPPFNVFGSCRWQSETVLELDLRYIETPHTERWIVTFESDAIKAVEYKTNAYYHDPILIYRAISELK
jgi:hypothetical protein